MTERFRLGPGREFALIEQFIGTAHENLVVGIGDDCAVLSNGTVITVDTSVDGVHFRRDWLSHEEIGYRSAAVALSDLAAMAATPIALFCALSLPQDDYGEPAVQLMRGVQAAAAAIGATVAGGDTTRVDGPLSLSVTAVGRAEQPVLRAGARSGDAVYVTGRLGAASAALHAWQQGSEPSAEQRAAFAAPRPRIREALWLAARASLHALIDISDGLLGDARHIAAASQVRLELDAELVPRASGATLEQANGGDDYELLFTADAEAMEALIPEFERTFSLDLTRIGAVRAGSDAVLVGIDGEPIQLPSYDHFGARP